MGLSCVVCASGSLDGWPSYTGDTTCRSSIHLVIPTTNRGQTAVSRDCRSSSRKQTTGNGKSSTGVAHARRYRTTFTPDQLFHLNRQFAVNRYIESDERARLASFLGLTESQVNNSYVYKGIITTVIGPLDDRTYCGQSSFTHLELWRKLYNCSLHHFTTSQCILKRALLTFSTTSNRLAEI